jgi:hypothetical protein
MKKEVAKKINQTITENNILNFEKLVSGVKVNEIGEKVIQK